LTGIVLLLLGAVMLVGGAELFAENVTSAARRVGLTALALGVLLAGAEPEEAVTAALASARDHPELAAGDALGANFVVLTLSLGLAALLTPLPVSRRVREYAVAAAVAGVAVIAVLADGTVGRLEGGLLVAAYVVAVAWVWRRERRPPTIGEMAENEADDDLDDPHEPDRSVAPAAFTGSDKDTAQELADPEPGALGSFALLLVLAGVLLMVGGGWLAVTGAERLVEGFGLDDTGVGLTLLALATSAEMLALVLAAGRHRVAEVALAGLVGAVAYNATVSLGVGALVAPLDGVGSPRFLAVAAACAVLPLTFLLLGRMPQTAARVTGGALVAAYVVAVPVLLL
jgi:cation:H+ antiporter